MTDTVEITVHKSGSFWWATRDISGHLTTLNTRYKTKREAVATAERWRDGWLAKDYQVYITTYDGKGKFQSQELLTICRGNNQ